MYYVLYVYISSYYSLRSSYPLNITRIISRTESYNKSSLPSHSTYLERSPSQHMNSTSSIEQFKYRLSVNRLNLCSMLVMVLILHSIVIPLQRLYFAGQNFCKLLFLTISFKTFWEYAVEAGDGAKCQNFHIFVNGIEFAKIMKIQTREISALYGNYY